MPNPSSAFFLKSACAIGIGLLVTGTERAKAAIVQTVGLANPATTITFDEIVLEPGTPLTDQYSELGVTFSPNLFYNPDPNVLNPPDPSIPGNNAIGNFVIEMTGPVLPTINPFSIELTQSRTEAAFGAATAFPNTLELTALLDGEEIESYSAQTSGSVDLSTNQLGPPNFLFYGFSDILFDEIRVELQPIADAGPGFVGIQIDNVQLGGAQSVPEPGSLLALLAVGVSSMRLVDKASRR